MESERVGEWERGSGEEVFLGTYKDLACLFLSAYFLKPYTLCPKRQGRAHSHDNPSNPGQGLDTNQLSSV
jgi:hypothetical protein